MSIASTVQQTLFPAPETQDPNFFIRSHYQSASECGGDWWGYFQSQNKLCLMIADATGHGLPSALITAAARSCFSVISKLAQEDTEFSFSPAAMLSYANRVVYEASLGKIMMTFFIATIDFVEGTITYSSAGHNPPWLFKKEGNSFALKSLVAVGNRLGEGAELAQVEEKTMSISAGDILFLYTDGLMEGKDLKGDQYGKKRTRKVVEAALPGGPNEIVKTIMEDFLKYNEGKALDDDITIAATLILKGAKA
jgi:sigma-B regulation protein RsbU (phosphoserine phosphatase)